jgi:hypothetical protein
VISGSIIALRAFIGPLPFHIHSPMNAESVFGIGLILMLLARSDADGIGENSQVSRLQTLALGAALIVLTAAAFWRTLGFYFLSDDFVLLNQAQARPDLRALFTVGGGDGFFRPVGYLSLALNSLWASFNPAIWHGSALVCHIANSLLVFVLALQICSSRLTAFFAAALFAVHGSRPEAVAWISAHFDRVSAFFFLCGLILFIHSLRKTAHPRLCRVLALACMILAILSKEAAFIFPGVLFLFMLQQKVEASSAEGRKDAAPGRYRPLIPFFAVAALLFAYRWMLFGGIGGYRDIATGRPTIWMTGFVSAAKVLLFRLWAVLFFPINWKTQPGFFFSILLTLAIGALCWTAFSRSGCKPLVFPLGFVLLAALPPLHLLLIGSDLQKSRLLYLPSVGFCLLLGLAVERMTPRVRLLVPAALMIFHLAALAHNLDGWAYASEKARDACTEAVRHIGPGTGKVVVAGLPQSLDGIAFFANGFPECVQMQRKGPPVSIELQPESKPIASEDDSSLLWWDSSARELRSVAAGK